MSRDELKAACVARLSTIAVEHPAGHQGKLAARFILRSESGEAIEIMFEKGPTTSANLWIHQKYAEPILSADIQSRESPARTLYAVVNDKGRKVYGRHTALLAMRQLADADLVCFKLATIAELDLLIQAMRRH